MKRTGAECDVDIRKFVTGKLDFSKEVAKLKNTSFRTFILLMVYLGEMLVFMYLIKVINDSQNQSFAFAFVALLPLIGIFFGGLYSEGVFLKPIMNLTKSISLIVCAAFYRYMLLKIRDHNDLVLLMVLKIVYKLVIYLGGVICSQKIAKRVFPKGESSTTDYFDQIASDEFYFMKYPIYMF